MKNYIQRLKITMPVISKIINFNEQIQTSGKGL